MKRLLFPAFVVTSLGAGLLVASLVSACDPDLSIQTVPGEGGAEAAATDSAAPPPVDGGPASEAGPSEGGTEAGAPEHLIDGTNDFTAGEKFATTSANYDGYVSWDDKKVYFGMSGADVGSLSNQKWVLIYVDGNPGNAGSPDGIAYDCSMACPPQQAHLPFNAGYHIQWQASGNYTNLQKWNAGTMKWDLVGPISTVVQKGSFMELSITRALLGAPPSKLKVHMTMLIEKPVDEWTYAGVPTGSFVDGPAPASFGKYFEFDLSDRTKAPNTYAPK